MNLKNKAAIYIRVSTQFQIDKDSLNVQRRELGAYSQLVLGIPDFDVFEDPGYSGKDTSRPAYQQMMSKLRTGDYSHLLVWKIDRISRNLLDFAEMYTELKRIGVTFVSKNEQFDTSTAIGEAMLKIILVFAELERKMTAERVTAVMLSRAANGQWNGGRIPFGYDWDAGSKSFSVNEKEADVYRFICNLYEERQSIFKVCEELNSRGIATKTGGPWNTVGVHKVLTNVFYKGVYRYNVHSDGHGNEKRSRSEWIEIDDHHPALIDSERFDRITTMLKRNARRGPKRGDTYTGKAIHIFAGLLVCGNCGENMTASLDRRRADGYRPSMYGCASRRRKMRKCTTKYINDLPVAQVVFPAISGVIRAMRSGKYSPGEIMELAKSSGMPDSVVRIDGLDAFSEAIKTGVSGMEYTSNLNLPGSAKPDKNAIRERKKRCESTLARLQSLYLYGESGITERDYLIERKKIISEIESLEESLKDQGDSGPGYEEDFVEKASYFIMIEKLIEGKPLDIKALDHSVPKAFLNRIIDQITIADDAVSEIRFKSQLTMRFIYDTKKPQL